jgi:hypothetical protein
MTVRELIEVLREISDQEGVICVPDYSLCKCEARDGEYQARTVLIKDRDKTHPTVVIE